MKTPVHLWIIAIISLGWNGIGAFDYLMSRLEIPSYMAMLTDAQTAFLEAAPLWFEATWAIVVWFSVLGSLLLFFRSRLARTCFGFSLLGLIPTTVFNYAIASPSATEIWGDSAPLFAALIFVILILLYLYARAMTRRGVLR